MTWGGIVGDATDMGELVLVILFLSIVAAMAREEKWQEEHRPTLLLVPSPAVLKVIGRNHREKQEPKKCERQGG